MGKISKLMKLLSASAVVAGANSVALADCDLCGDKTDDHKVSACPHFDYRGYGLSKGYKPETLPDNDFLAKLALADRKNADAFLNAPKSTTVTFLSDNSDSATTVSESDTAETATALEEMEREEAAVKIQSARRGQLAREAARSRAVNAEIARLNEKAARQRDTKELRDMMRERVAEDLGKSDAVKSTSDVQDLDLRHRGAEEAKGVAYDNRAGINISDREKIRILAENISQADERRARARDNKEFQRELKNFLEENREKERNERLSEAQALSEKRKALENERATGNREAETYDPRKIPAAANKIQNAARARLARKKAAELRKRQAQIDSDYELAKKLQAEYNAEDAQIRADRLLAEQEQLRKNLAAEPVAEAQNGADFEYRSEQDQINTDNLLAQQEQAREYLGMNAQEPSNATATREVVVADEENETDRWTLPQATAWNFRGFDFERMSSRRQADTWARQLDNLSIRKLECMLWLVSTSYQQLQNAGRYAPSAQMAEAISDVNNIFPYSGTNAGIMNVYKAFENTDAAGFVQDLERLGKSGLDGVLYYIANRCMHLLLSGKKAASAKLIELEKAVVEYFNGVWEADNAAIVPDNANVVEAPRDPVNFKANGGEITETEPQETEQWHLPYRVYYAYCLNIKHGLRPSSGSRRVHQNPELFKADLRSRNIRRLEAVIYLANLMYRIGLQDGALPISNEFVKLVEDVYNIFPDSGEKKANARVLNVYRAYENFLDEPNDNPISMQPFQKGFRELTSNEKVLALGDLAVAYREKLREGHRPASMAIVNWANEICKEFNRDGYRNGQDNVHPEMKFEEFENKAEKPAVASDAAGNPAVVAENHQEPADVGAREPESDWEPTEWKLPEDVYNSLEFRYEGYYSRPDRETSNEGQARERLQKQISALNVRQLEALLGLASAAYTQKLEEDYASPISNRIAQQAKDIFQLITHARHGENEHLLNVLETVNKADAKRDFQRDVKRLPERQIEALIAMIAEVYDDRVDEGAVPSAPEFKKFSHDILKLMSLKYWDEEEGESVEDEATNDPRRNALEGDNGVLIDPARAS